MAEQLVVANAIICTAGGSDRLPRDIVIQDGRIVAIRPSGEEQPSGRRIDADGGVVIPGLTDAHMHSHELYMRGRVWGSALEPYILRISPRFAPEDRPTEEDIYDRTLATCVELLLGGVTLAIDDVEHPAFEDRYVDPVLQAYHDCGMRARVSILTEELGWIDSIAHLKELLPADVRPAAGESGALVGDTSAQLALYRRAIERWRGRSARVGLMVSPSAPQRCSAEFFQALFTLAEEYDVPFAVHIQESLMQAACGPAFFGSSMIQYVNRLGALSPRTIVAHGIWLDDADIATIAAAGATVSHNPASNLKLGSGVARVRAMLRAGVNVALGCDGYTCNDSQDLFEAMKLAAGLSCIASTDPADWLSPAEALRMATRNGPTAAGLPELGRIEPGAPADLVVLDPLAPGLNPLGDPVGQVVFAAKRGDVRTVIVDGKVLVEDRAVLAIDVPALYRRVQTASERLWAAAQPSLAENARLMPYFLEAVRRSALELPPGLFRYVPDGSAWVAERSALTP